MAKKGKKKERTQQRQKERRFEEKPGKRTIRHNTAANQAKHRVDWQPLQPDEEGEVADRRIMPMDELDRRKGLLLTSKLEFQEDFAEAMWQTLRKEGAWSGAIWNRRRDGEVYQEWLSVSAIRDEDHRVVAYVGIFSDISSIASREHQLERMAYFDPLTELPNQLLFHDRLTQALGFARRLGDALSVAVLNLDRISTVNEQYGYLAGDRILQEMSRCVLSELGERDSVGRIGGDEFSLVMFGGRERASRTAEGIRAALARPGSESEPPVTITASIARFPGDADDAGTLLAHARAAMYAAKEEGGNRIRYYADVRPGGDG